MKVTAFTALGGAVVLSSVFQLAMAQGAPPAGAAPGAPPAAADNPTALPGDRVPGPMMGPPPGGAGGPPGGAGGKPPPEQGTDARGPTLAVAIEAAQAALDACKADGYNVGVSVIDSAGQPRVALSQDGATGGHVYTGVRKSLAALAFGMPTSQIAAAEAADKSVATKAKPNMAMMAGAVPLMAGKDVIGAIGVSGASSLQDEKCAAAGAAKVKSKLK